MRKHWQNQTINIYVYIYNIYNIYNIYIVKWQSLDFQKCDVWKWSENIDKNQTINIYVYHL